MARKDRRSSSLPQGARPASTRALDRRSAPSGGLSDLAYSEPASAGAAIDAPRVYPRRSTARGLPQTPPTRRKAPPPSLSAFFLGAWPSPTSLSRQALPSPLAHGLACARRHSRREVLFATRSTGKGSFSRKKYYSNRSCK